MVPATAFFKGTCVLRGSKSPTEVFNKESRPGQGQDNPQQKLQSSTQSEIPFELCPQTENLGVEKAIASHNSLLEVRFNKQFSIPNVGRFPTFSEQRYNVKFSRRKQ